MCVVPSLSSSLGAAVRNEINLKNDTTMRVMVDYLVKTATGGTASTRFIDVGGTLVIPANTMQIRVSGKPPIGRFGPSFHCSVHDPRPAVYKITYSRGDSCSIS